jgi:altronate dehydratase
MTYQSFVEIEDLSLDEIEMIDGGKATVSTVLAYGAAVTAVGALVLATPLMAPVAGAAAGAYAVASVAMGLGAAVTALAE